VSDKIERAGLYNNELIQTAISEDIGIKAMVEPLYKDEINPLFIKFIKDGQDGGFIKSDLSVDTISIYIECLPAWLEHIRSFFPTVKIC
jgi:hypothetical protein